MTDASEYLLKLAKRITEPYTKLPTCRAAMITGSVAKGLADYYSDIDMTIYYEGELPPMAEFDRIRVENGGGDRKWMIGDHSTGSFAAAYDVNGIEVQIGHTTIAELQKQFAVVLVQHETDTPLHKALEGTLNSIALYG
ncbi:MAG: nucleotidyltransferase domain-containing protein, partial [Chloroflexota bacterium]